MTQSATTTNGDAQFRGIGVAGRDVVSAREQIASILGSRIGREAASLLAVAHTDGGDGEGVTWRAEGGAQLTPITSLSPERAQRLRERHRELAAEIESLASRLDAEGDSGHLVAHLLRLALVTPDGYEALHAVGDQPVLVNWGHAVKGQSIPEMGGRYPPSVTADSTPGDSPLSVGLTAPAANPAHRVADGFHNASAKLEDRRNGAWWIAWLLPLVLLGVVAAILWNLTRPPVPIAVKSSPPAPLPDDPRPAARSRLAALESELANAQALQLELAGLCLPGSEVSIERAESVPPAPPAIVEPRARPDPQRTREPPAAIAEPGLGPEHEPAPPVMPRRRTELPPEVPRTPASPPRVAQLPPPETLAPTLCKPRWTPTQRPEVMLVVDGSGSMKDPFPGAASRLDAAKNALSLVVGNLHHEITTGLVSFTDCGETSTPVKYAYRDRPELLARVRRLSASRKTSLANSIRRAGNAAKSVGPVTVVVVSDGDDTCGGDPCGAARALKGRKPLLEISVLDMSGGGSAALQCVAEVTGGRVFVPETAAQMNEELQEATGQPDAGHCSP